MTQVMDMMRTLKDNVAASRSEQERMHEALVASQARNEELNRVNEELRKTLQEREEQICTPIPTAQLSHAIFSKDHGLGGPGQYSGGEGVFHRGGGP